MASGSFKQTEVVCPFYRFDDGRRRITCEGIMDGCNVALIFRDKADFDRQLEVFCCEHCKKCEVYRMVMEKYEN